MESRSDKPAWPDSSLAAAERIRGYDVARSLALLGMIVVHFGLVMGAEQTTPAWAAEIMQFLDGRAAGTFVVLAGVGLTLRSRKAAATADQTRLAGVRRTLRLRGLFLLGIGFVNLVIWPGDILRVYGVSLILAASFLDAPNRRLLEMTAVFVLGFVVLILTVNYDKNWEWETLQYHGLWTASGLFRNLFYDGFRSVFPWTGFVFFGMWLGRKDVRDRAVNTRFLLAGVAITVITELTSRLLLSYFLSHRGEATEEEIKALFGTLSMPPLPLFLLSAGGTATVIIALCVRLAETWPAAFWLNPLAATGQMALTWYFGHIILGLGTVVLCGLTASQPLPVAQGCGVLFFALAVGISWLWKKRFRHGPLEWGMRRLAG
jgi:uncharacterized membrane protein YeiB